MIIYYSRLWIQISHCNRRSSSCRDKWLSIYWLKTWRLIVVNRSSEMNQGRMWGSCCSAMESDGI